MLATAQHEFVGLQILRAFVTEHAASLAVREVSDERGDDLAGEFVLHREHVFDLAVVTLRPQVVAGRGLDELRRYTDPVAAFAYAALEDVAHVERLAHVRHVHGLTLVGERRVARDDHDFAKPRQFRDDVLADPVGEIHLVLVVAHVCKRQYGDRRFRRQDPGDDPGRIVTRRTATANTANLVDPDWTHNVLHFVLPDELDRFFDLALDEIEDLARQRDAAGRCETFETRGDIHTVAVDRAVALLDDVAEVHPDPVLHAAIRRHLIVARFEFALHLDGAVDRFDDTVENGEDTVAGRVHDPAVMCGD